MNVEPAQKKWISPAEVSAQLGVTGRTVRTYIARGDLPASRLKGSRLVRIRQSDVDALLDPIPTAGDALLDPIPSAGDAS